MASLSQIIYEEPMSFENTGINFQAVLEAAEPTASLHGAATVMFKHAGDPVRKAALARIALVSIEDNAHLPTLLSDDSAASPFVQRIKLPRNPRIAGDELYELDSMDMIVMASETAWRISKETMRWLKLLKQLGVPMIVLLPVAPAKKLDEYKVEQFSQYVGLPVIPVATDTIDKTRQEFVNLLMQLAPATALALAAHIPHFRSSVTENVLATAINTSLKADGASTLSNPQIQLVRQICAAHGQNGQQLENHRVALETLVTAMTYYTSKLITVVPMKNTSRRTRLAHALSTLFVGYATMIYLGATPPSIRKDVVPQIWRLYRASGKPVLE